MTTLNGTTVLITGSSSGLGNQTARTLLEHGATVIATMRHLNTKNQTAADALREYANTVPGTLHLIEMDVADEASVEAAFATALATTERIDVVINNAGIGGGGLTEAFSVDQFRKTFDVNVLGVQRVMRAALPPMRQQGYGLIINVSSAMGRMVIPYAGAYTASKYALEGLSESYRYELAGTGVQVVIMEPGGFMTGYWSGMMAPEDTDRAASYGEAAAVPDQLWSGIPDLLSGSDAASPANFAEAVIDVIQTAPAERPLRVVVDPVTGGDAPKAINAATEPVQRSVLNAFGLGDLLQALPDEKA
ncbi:MAG: SDR family oxidoreductase [Chloroflexota bacterium]